MLFGYCCFYWKFYINNLYVLIIIIYVHFLSHFNFLNARMYEIMRVHCQLHNKSSFLPFVLSKECKNNSTRLMLDKILDKILLAEHNFNEFSSNITRDRGEKCCWAWKEGCLREKNSMFDYPCLVMIIGIHVYRIKQER